MLQKPNCANAEPDDIPIAGDAMSQLKWLDGSRLELDRFGGKAAELAEAISQGARTPLALAVTADLARRLDHSEAMPVEVDRLRQALDMILLDSPIGCAILRSSHELENGTDMTLAGHYPSIAGIGTFGDLVAAFAHIREQANAIPFLLQSEIPCSHSAVMLSNGLSAKIEIFAGGLADPIAGCAPPNAVVKAGSCAVRGWDFEVAFDDGSLDENLLGLASECLAAVDFATDGVRLFEMGRCEGSWNVLQVQRVDEDSLFHLIDDHAADFAIPVADHQVLGKKAAAMLYFKGHGLFHRNLAIFRPHEIPTDSAELFFEGWCRPFTVRFSMGSALGLPRVFTDSPEEAFELIRTRPHQWSAIVHEFIPVARSFEALLTRDAVYLEHVPGMWESDCRTPPDALTVDAEGRCSGYYWSAPRTARCGLKVVRTEIESPATTPADMEHWGARISDVLVRLAGDFEDAFPMNIHFVEDDEGQWHFLNIRTGYESARNEAGADKTVFRVRTLADLERWDGSSPILLGTITARGGEMSLEPLALALKQVNAPIYSEFGILSHPAMVLLALGVPLKPGYLLKSWQKETAYSHHRFHLDRGVEPLLRIAGEPFVHEDDDLLVVADREPIIADHLLVVSKHFAAGFADSLSLRNAFARLRLDALTGGGKILFYERGRATFCSSGFSTSHAHMHLLPLLSFRDDTIAALARQLRADSFASLADAWTAAAALPGEYLLFGTSDGETYLTGLGMRMDEKRFIRNFLRQHLT